ncbi:acidic ribosomal protein p2 [Stylonychia lemnae]|uniref:Acidic ribosomal protein p2 n=1 Tax=Stylonychia lemnae TaxID=5949 RepID=A0A078B6E4_STYLE|nr:acidic ribosomal protein p2 [Stylonychia lemnae]|eukprot:CDW89934.1 acidic ribosomal protein p2 [Stylonychia lemnae]
MKHLAAYCLLVLAGKQNPTADEVSKLLKDVGVQPVKEDLDSMIKALAGKKVHDLVRDGSKKLASVPQGGSVSAAPVQTTAAAAAPAKEKEEEKKKEEEADVDMGGLFGDDY